MARRAARPPHSRRGGGLALGLGALLLLACGEAPDAPPAAPVEQYSAFGDRIPRDLEDAVAECYRRVPETFRAEYASLPESEAVGGTHLSFGAWMRRQWELWAGWDDGEPSRLRLWFEARGVRHGDNMSTAIQIAFWRSLNGRPCDIGSLLAEFPELVTPDPAAEMSDHWPVLPGTDTIRGSAAITQVVVDAEGRTKHGGQVYPSEQLLEVLFTNAEIQRDEADGEKPSLTAVRLQCHRDAPFAAARAAMRACADPAVRIRRVFFAVRHPETGAFETVAASPAILRAAGPPLPPEGPDTAVIHTTAETRVGEVVARLADLRRAGCRRVVFRDAADPASDFLVTLGGE